MVKSHLIPLTARSLSFARRVFKCLNLVTGLNRVHFLFEDRVPSHFILSKGVIGIGFKLPSPSSMLACARERGAGEKGRGGGRRRVGLL